MAQATSSQTFRGSYMSRPQLNTTDLVYLDILCAMTGESKHGAISRALVFACKHGWKQPKYAHYFAIARDRLSKLREMDRSDCG